MADRKISDLTALTAPASGDYLPIVDISESAAASKNKRITIEELMRGAPDGTAAAPSIAFESDPNTGIYSPGTDQVAISTNGTGRLFVDSSGLLGLGTSSPGRNLDITSSDTWIRTARTSGNAWLIGPGVQDAFRIYDDTAGVERFRIEATTGRVGIGTTSPATTLDVNGDVTITDKIIHGGDTNTAIRFPAADTVSVETGGSERARIDSSGRLLVGTSSDSGGALLQVNDNRIRIATANTPASAGATGTTGEIAWDADYIYVCTATNTWKRTAIATW
jgi:hypothetical protein